MLRRPALALLAVLLPAAAFVATPAHAGSWSAPDPAGDAVSMVFDEDPPPCGTVIERPTRVGDLRRISVRHTTDRVLVRLDVTGLGAVRQSFADVTIVTPEKAFTVSVSRTGGRTAVAVAPFHVVDPDDIDECGYYSYESGLRPCRGAVASVRPGHGRITLSVPRRCLLAPRWVRVGAGVSTFSRRGPTVDGWYPRGWHGDQLAPVVGRRVHAAR